MRKCSTPQWRLPSRQLTSAMVLKNRVGRPSARKVFKKSKIKRCRAHYKENKRRNSSRKRKRHSNATKRKLKRVRSVSSRKRRRRKQNVENTKPRNKMRKNKRVVSHARKIGFRFASKKRQRKSNERTSHRSNVKRNASRKKHRASLPFGFEICTYLIKCRLSLF